MLKVSILEMCLRGFPESLLFLWAIDLINMKEFNIKKLFSFGFILTIVIYFVRLLPIQYGVNTLIAVGILITSEHFINKLPLEKAISSSLIVVTLLSICEFLNIAVLMYFFKATVKQMVTITYTKILTSIPSVILFVMFILIFNKFNRKIKMKGTMQ